MAARAEVLAPVRTKKVRSKLGLRGRLARWAAAGQLGGSGSIAVARYTGARV